MPPPTPTAMRFPWSRWEVTALQVARGWLSRHRLLRRFPRVGERHMRLDLDPLGRAAEFQRLGGDHVLDRARQGVAAAGQSAGADLERRHRHGYLDRTRRLAH